MKRLLILALMLGCAAALVEPANGQNTASPRTNQPAVTIHQLFAGTLVLKEEAGELRIPVTLSGVSFENHQVVRNLKSLAGGLALVEFTGGKIETIIDERGTRSKAAKFVILPPGASPTFTTDDDSAGLRIILLAGPLTNFSGKPIDLEAYANAQYKEASPGLLQFPAFSAVTLNDYVLEGQNLLISSRQKTEEFTLQGASLLEVQTGAGTLFVNGRSQRVKGGTVVTVTQGARLQIANQRADLGLSIRATVLRKR